MMDILMELGYALGFILFFSFTPYAITFIFIGARAFKDDNVGLMAVGGGILGTFHALPHIVAIANYLK